MKKNISSSVGVIQADTIHNSVILQIIDGVNDPADVEPSICKVAEHLDKLTKKRGLLDGRILLAVLATAGIAAAQYVPFWPALSLYMVSALFIAIGYHLTTVIRCLDIETDATKTFLTELYKIRLRQKLNQ
ncbi:MAG: hypothetical protein B6I36_02430 [Desulfobacteraceae bacterium 4572_35.1]|nr:MAG: hypothetical protein B6I36_02430 [Desulfobacteraceae bacterium 4572_35.1]